MLLLLTDEADCLARQNIAAINASSHLDLAKAGYRASGFVLRLAAVPQLRRLNDSRRRNLSFVVRAGGWQLCLGTCRTLEIKAAT